MYGPLVLAADEALMGTAGVPISAVGIGNPALSALAITPEPAPASVKSWPDARVYHLNAVLRRHTATAKAGSPLEIRLSPFADAGDTNRNFRVWLPLRIAANDNLLLEGTASLSRQVKSAGDINDDNLETCVGTFDNKLLDEDWFAIT